MDVLIVFYKGVIRNCLQDNKQIRKHLHLISVIIIITKLVGKENMM